MPRKTLELSLFWRTFCLLAILLAGGVFAWVQTLRALEFEPRAVQAAQQIASLVNLARVALAASDTINRVALVKSMAKQESVRLLPHEPGDQWEPFEVDRFSRDSGWRGWRTSALSMANSPVVRDSSSPSFLSVREPRSNSNGPKLTVSLSVEGAPGASSGGRRRSTACTRASSSRGLKGLPR